MRFLLDVSALVAYGFRQHMIGPGLGFDPEQATAFSLVLSPSLDLFGCLGMCVAMGWT